MTTPTTTAPDIDALRAPHEGWTLLPGHAELGFLRSFVSGDPGGQRLRVSYFRRDDDAALVGRAWFGPMAEGPPGHAHGGSMAALLDEVMGASCWLNGHRVLAAKIEITFKKSLALGGIATFMGRPLQVDGRRLTAEGTLWSPSDDVVATGTGLFIVVSAERLAAMMAGREA